MGFFSKNKVQPVPPPKHIREIKISRNPWKKSVKWTIFVIILLAIIVGVWVGVVANQALKKITAGSEGNSSIFSFLGDFNSNIKGKNDGRTNILLLGMGGKNHPGGMLSDTIISASINYEQKRIGLISIPRDLWAPIPGFNHAKINEAYSKGEDNKNSTSGGGALASRTVENVLGIPVHYYISLDFEGFKKIVDTVGGVDIYVENEINDPYYPAADMIRYDPFRISAGMHHMDGDLALKYARSRKTTSDFDRSRRQMQVMAAIREKILSLGILANPKKITDLINILGDHIRTNMSVSDIRALWDESKDLDTTNIVNKVLDTSTDGLLKASQDGRGYYVYPQKGIDNFTAVAGLAKNLFESNSEARAQAKIEVSNAAGRKGAASAVSQYLESYGFQILKIDTASKKIDKTVVYDFSQGQFTKTAQDLAAKLKADLQTLNQVGSSYDIQVLVGTDYLNNI
ncbi:MAG: LCP family protein [Patescibacteria group bacterium]